MLVEDIPEMLPIVEHAWNDTLFGKINENYDEDSAFISLRRMWMDPTYYCLVYVIDNWVEGAMIVKKVSPPVNNEFVYGVEVLLDANKDLSLITRGRIIIELFRYMSEELKQDGITSLIVGVKPNNSLKSYIEGLGGKVAEIQYLLELQP